MPVHSRCPRMFVIGYNERCGYAFYALVQESVGGVLLFDPQAVSFTPLVVLPLLDWAFRDLSFLFRLLHNDRLCTMCGFFG